MQITLHWQKPVPLRKDRSGAMISLVDLESLPENAGLYLFYRTFGKSREVLYLGRSANIRRRTKSHLNSLKLMRHLQSAKNGKLFIAAGVLEGSYRQTGQKRLEVAERAMIRHYVAQGHNLANQQGVKLRHHTLTNLGPLRKGFVPGEVFVER